jgi:diacylglycerol kinase (ATP)
MQESEPKRGAARIIGAFFISLRGLGCCFREEEAFRQEVLLYLVLLPVILLMPVSPALKLILFFTNSLVLIVEVLNSAVEAVVDLASPEYHELAGRAKDMGSAAVFISLTVAGVSWASALLLILFR